jgi:tetratricopeptide (TPR) repeat protein
MHCNNDIPTIANNALRSILTTFLHYSKGDALSGLSKYNEAITYYDKALAIDPNNALESKNKNIILEVLFK